VFRLKTATAGAVELGLASGMKPLAILKQAGLDPGNVRNILAAEPKCIAHAGRSLPRSSLCGGRAGERGCRQYQTDADNHRELTIRSHLHSYDFEWTTLDGGCAVNNGGNR
jgi:hypothetical protein